MSRMILRTAFVAVFVLAAACGGDDDGFEPAAGGSVEVEELEGLIREALSEAGMEATMVQPIPLPQDLSGLPSCFETQSAGPCRIERAPGLSVAFRGEDGLTGGVTVQLGVDELEAGDLLGSAMVSRSSTPTETLRVLAAGTVPPQGIVGGRCDPEADRNSGDGCAWRARRGPNVGDEALAMRAEVLESNGFSAAAFFRGHVFAEIEVRRRDNGDAPDGIADDLAEALDEQIKQAFSR